MFTKRPDTITASSMPSNPRSHPYNDFPSYPFSVVSASSIASSSRQASPIMTPEAPLFTGCSSIQASPEQLPLKDDDQFPAFQLPPSIISRKTSTNSLTQAYNRGGLPLPIEPTSAPAKGGLIRRLSSRASRTIGTRRRQSSANPNSRSTSVGPCFLRRRSDSNTTAPMDYAPASIDSESDLEDREDRSIFGLEGVGRDAAAQQQWSPFNPMDTPIVPLPIMYGTQMTKISKKNRWSDIAMSYQPEHNRLVWHKGRTAKFLHLDEISQIRTGDDVRQYALEFGARERDCECWFSIWYNDPAKTKPKTLHLVAEDPTTCQTWVQFLEAMQKHRQEMMISLMAFKPQALRDYWQKEMLKKTSDPVRAQLPDEIDLALAKRFCQELHIYTSQSAIDESFATCDVRRRHRLNFDEFVCFIRHLNQRRDVQRIIRSSAANPESGLTLEEFLTFLRDVQKEDVDSQPQLWIDRFKTFASHNESGEAGEESLMTESSFAAYLSSAHNGPLEAARSVKLDRPLNEYFIYSSHNTYLTGRQVAGESSVEPYITALQRGCRCVEVDTWNGNGGEILVTHGRTLTSACSFQEVIRCINKYAFYTTEYPLFISIENHCLEAQQTSMAHIMKETFGDKLITEPLDWESEVLPSPEALKGRILIKVKQPIQDDQTSTQGTGGRRRGNSVSSLSSAQDRSMALQPSQSLPQSPLLTPSLSSRRLVNKTRVNTIAEGEVPGAASASTSDNEPESGSDSGSARKPANKTIKILGDLGVYCAGLKFRGFDVPEAKTYNHIFSFMETSFARHSQSKEKKMALDIHNIRYFMRVYPDGLRLGSSNFDPLAYWRRGVQMAALNWQTYDHGQQINRAMFSGGSDSSGYVLKPPELRTIQHRSFSEDLAKGKKERSVVSFNIDVSSASQLIPPAHANGMDHYIEVEVCHADDGSRKKEPSVAPAREGDSPRKFQTEIIRGNGFNPMYIDGRFQFRVTTKNPDLVFVRWSVKLSNDGESYSNKTVATYTAKLKNLKEGFRPIPLENHTGETYLFSTLLCKIQKDPIVTTMVDATHKTQEGRKLHRLGNRVLSRKASSPRATLDKDSFEKSSFEV